MFFTLQKTNYHKANLTFTTSLSCLLIEQNTHAHANRIRERENFHGSNSWIEVSRVMSSKIICRLALRKKYFRVRAFHPSSSSQALSIRIPQATLRGDSRKFRTSAFNLRLLHFKDRFELCFLKILTF